MLDVEIRTTKSNRGFLGATEGTEDTEIRSKEVGQEGSLIADYAGLRGFLGATEDAEFIKSKREDTNYFSPDISRDF